MQQGIKTKTLITGPRDTYCDAFFQLTSGTFERVPCNVTGTRAVLNANKDVRSAPALSQLANLHSSLRDSQTRSFAQHTAQGMQSPEAVAVVKARYKNTVGSSGRGRLASITTAQLVVRQASRKGHQRNNSTTGPVGSAHLTVLAGLYVLSYVGLVANWMSWGKSADSRRKDGKPDAADLEDDEMTFLLLIACCSRPAALLYWLVTASRKNRR